MILQELGESIRSWMDPAFRWMGLPRRPGRQIRDFLGLARLETADFLEKEFPSWQTPDLVRGIQELPALLGATLDVGPTVSVKGQSALRWMLQNPDQGRFIGIDHQDFEIDGAAVSLPTTAVFRLARSEDPAARCVFELDLYDRTRTSWAAPNEACIARAPRSGSRGFVDHAFRTLGEWMGRRSLYRGGCLRPLHDSDGDVRELVRIPVDLDPSRITLPRRVREQLDSELFDFLTHADMLDDLGLGSRRGILFVGEPGTGKTTTCRYIKSRLPEYTMLVVERDGFAHLGKTYEIARLLAPSIVVIEDVDLIGRAREINARDWILGELMNQLDGLGSRDRVLTLLTSNCYEELESALVDRPGRVDRVIPITGSTEASRREVLETYLGPALAPAALDLLTARTEGWTPALLKELAKKCVVAAMRETGRLELTSEILESALGDLRNRPTAYSRRVIGLMARPDREGPDRVPRSRSRVS